MIASSPKAPGSPWYATVASTMPDPESAIGGRHELPPHSLAHDVDGRLAIGPVARAQVIHLVGQPVNPDIAKLVPRVEPKRREGGIVEGVRVRIFDPLAEQH